MPRILVVNDEAPIVDAISYNLKKEGFEVDSAADADECLTRIREAKPDLLILDVMLPSGSGLDVCSRMHGDHKDMPVLLLTARAAAGDRLRGFDSGADDYVVKPFSMRELMARVHAILRRSRGEGEIRAPKPLLTANGLRINPDRREVVKEGRAIALSRKEFDLLSLLASNQGHVFDRQTLLSRVCGEDSCVDDRTVHVHIRWLREKIEEVPARPEMILTVRGVGYKFQG